MLHLALRRLASGFYAVGLLAACAGETDGAPVAGPASEEELRELTLKITAAGAGAEVADSPALKTGATGALVCADRFASEEGVRLSCTRGKELVEILVRRDAPKVVVVHRPEGRAKDTRTFFTCDASGNGPGDLPAKLKCASKAPETRPGGLASPFASTVVGLDVPNAHAVGQGGMVFRGMAPREGVDFDQLSGLGVGAVLIFKNATGSEVADEKAELAARGIAAARTLDVPFKWKGLTSFKEPCEQTVDALAFLEANAGAGHKTFFHCTVGEDRTGLLAAVHRLLAEPALDAARAFDLEMCERGYGAGNPLKPGFVVGQVESNLTPLYRKLAFLVKSGKLKPGALDKAACSADPEDDASFDGAAVPAARLRCGTSTAFAP